MPPIGRIVALAWLFVSIPSLAHAQLVQHGVIEAGGGGIGTIQGVGSFASVRVRGYFSERVSAGPELQQWHDGYGRTLFVVGGNVFFDVVAASDENRVVPYAFITGGAIAVVEASGGPDLLVGCGFGLRFHVTDRLVISPELRRTLPTGTGAQVSIGWMLR
jgi:hypothetical protein